VQGRDPVEGVLLNALFTAECRVVFDELQAPKYWLSAINIISGEDDPPCCDFSF